jgi:hypothetical protein
VEHADELSKSCHCEKRSDEAIQLDCFVGIAARAMTNRGPFSSSASKNPAGAADVLTRADIPGDSSLRSE